MASGGARQGVPGTAYPNRTDLQQGTQPVSAPTGKGYGERKALEDAQRALPLPNQADQVIPIGAPTQRPDEHVMAGAPLGPGPGTEVLPDAVQARMQGIDTADLEALRPWLPFLEFTASRADSTPSTRNFVRRLRASLSQR